ncbi:MAG TPA: endonuclease IV, partial [Clostridiales bacterium]|nr:endonuclease IV [Clostridiales bacterium]
GSHVGQGVEKGIELTSSLLNKVLKTDQTTVVLLETMSGKGSEIGKTFQELRQIIDCTKLDDKLGICLDTCHIYDAGYDIVNDLDGVLAEFDRIIGLDRLYAVHINDSKNPISSHKDRHEKIGQGSLGLETFFKVINHPLLHKLPFFLETPNDNEGYAEEIRILKEAYEY